MANRPFLQPILEDVELGQEKTVLEEHNKTRENDSLFSIETYKTFTDDDWRSCCKIITFISIVGGLIGLICYISFITLK